MLGTLPVIVRRRLCEFRRKKMEVMRARLSMNRKKPFLGLPGSVDRDRGRHVHN